MKFSKDDILISMDLQDPIKTMGVRGTRPLFLKSICGGVKTELSKGHRTNFEKEYEFKPWA